VESGILADAALNRWWNDCPAMCWDGRLIFDWQILRRSGAILTNGYATECEPSNSSNGGAARSHIENFWHEGQVWMLRAWWREITVIYGGTADKR
jgi:hypothetical protein